MGGMIFDWFIHDLFLKFIWNLFFCISVDVDIISEWLSFVLNKKFLELVEVTEIQVDFFERLVDFIPNLFQKFICIKVFFSIDDNILKLSSENILFQNFFCIIFGNDIVFNNRFISEILFHVEIFLIRICFSFFESVCWHFICVK